MESFLTSVMTSHGYLALIIFAFIEACCIPISSEVTFALGGFLASPAYLAAHPHDKFSLLLVIIVGTAAEMCGSLTSYVIGRKGGRTLLERHGKWVLVSRSDLDRAERFFAGRGTWAVAVARVLPLIRCFASFGAGVVEIPVAPFAIFSLIGTAIWTTALSLLGYNLGDAVHKFFHSFSVVGVILAVAAILGLIAHRVHAIRKDSHASAANADGGSSAGDAGAADPGSAAMPAKAEAASSEPAKPRISSGRHAGAHRSDRTH